MVQQIQSEKLSREQGLSFISFSDPNDSERSQLRTARNFIINKFPLKKDFSWERICNWEELRKSVVYQNKVFLSERDLDYILELYKSWVKVDTCFALRNKLTKELKLIRASKRGNSVYRRLLNIKLDSILDFFEDPSTQDKLIKDVEGFRTKKEVSVLFVSLTCDQKLVNKNLLSAWFNIEDYYNRFITQFRQKYGFTFVIKTVEAQSNGYPHIHLFLISECRTKQQRRNKDKGRTLFNAFLHKGMSKVTGKLSYTWRVKEKPDIAKMWKFGFSDVKVPIDVSKGQSYKEFIKDYMFKDMFKSFKHGYKSKRDLRSLSLSWLFGKQCFSFSNHDLIQPVSVTQIQLEEIKKELEEKDFEFLGFVNISCKSSKPPPNKLLIKPTDREYKVVLRCIRKPYRMKKKFKVLNMCHKEEILAEHRKSDGKILNLMNLPKK